MSFQGGLAASRARCALPLAILLCLVWLTFSPAVNFQLLSWDDDINLQANPHLTGFSAESVKWMFTDFTYQWRYQPLAWVTWFTIFEIQGLDPFGYHLINVLFHLGNTLLVYLIARRLLAGKPKGEWGALLAAALWSLHPLRVEVVVWAVELLYNQSLFFLLGSYLAYLKATDGTASKGKWLGVAIVAFAGSLFTFPLALGFVAVLLLTDIYLLKSLPESPADWLGGNARLVWLEKLPFILLTVVATVLNFACRANATALFSTPATLQEFGILPRLMQAFYIWSYYLWRPFWPMDLTPVPTQLMDFQPFDGVFIASAVIVLAGSWLLFLLRRRYPFLWMVWLVHLAVLVPVLGLTEHPHFPSDRYSLVGSIAWAILLGGFWVCWAERVRGRLIQYGCALATVAVLAILSMRQLPFWANNFSFFPHVIAQVGENPFRFQLLSRLAVVHRRAGLRVEAERYFVEALQQEPNALPERLMLADSQMVMGKRQAGRENYRKLLELSPEMKGIHSRLAKMYQEEGNLAAAAHELGEELRLSPESFPLNMQYGQTLARAGMIDEAQTQFKKLDEMFELKPGDIMICQLAMADGLAALGKVEPAVELAKQVAQQASVQGVKGIGQMAEERLRRWMPVLSKSKNGS